MKVTDCECTSSGWCARHQVHKGSLLFQLCRHNQDVFEAWEAGTGPGQIMTAESADPDRDSGATAPGLVRRISNFGVAFTKHAANGMKNVGDEIFAARLAICQSCEYRDESRNICRHHGCGCTLTIKARWASEACPIGKWTAETADEQKSTPDQEPSTTNK